MTDEVDPGPGVRIYVMLTLKRWVSKSKSIVAQFRKKLKMMKISA